MRRLLSGATLKKLYDMDIYQSQYLNEIKQIMKERSENDDPSTVYPREILFDMYFSDSED